MGAPPRWVRPRRVSVIAALVFMATGALVGSVFVPYCVNTWLMWVGYPPVIEWWHGALIGCIPYVGWFSLVLFVYTFLFLDALWRCM